MTREEVKAALEELWRRRTHVLLSSIDAEAQEAIPGVSGAETEA